VPTRFRLFGVPISSTSCEETSRLAVEKARARERLCISSLAVHGLVIAAREPAFRRIVEEFDVLAPDGHPVRWLLNRLHKQRLSDRVCGTDLTLSLCWKCASEGIGIYLYGSTAEVNAALRHSLQSIFPKLKICGGEPSLFRPLTETEDRELVERINSSGAGVVFLGLGCPLQEKFAHAHRHLFTPVQVCVGAAFDFLSGNKRRAPRWMQARGLEWIHRALQEPRRLSWRYLSTNTNFLWLLISHL
jgi:N-acetylglucosaminyldiphosphoundecaprenol N-acetyl-beta-D-mannosaminyltransferase